jgi:zinc protease
MAMKTCKWILLLFLVSSPLVAAPTVELSKEINIVNKKFVLPNGLTLIVHEDHKAPIVAVNLWYHVGSKNEKPGKTGFAHLFEHLMFTGSEHLSTGHNQRAFFQEMESLGATDLNGTTSEDRTDFFENVPTNALNVALWMESDRMGHLLAAVDQAKLDEQRGVVQNEKRQNENQPYGSAEELIVKATAPANHPYAWTVIGSMEDLNAASLDDVRTWFKTYYGAANVVLVVAGDIKPDDALAKVTKYFGSIPSGPPVSHWSSWTAKMPGVRREVVSDHVPQARLYEVWNVPRYGDVDATRLDLVSDVLAEGKTSRLYKRLVYDEQIATDVEAFVDQREINSQFYIMVTLRPGQDLARAEADVHDELSRLIEKGPSEEELHRVKTQYFAGFIRGLQRIGGFGGVSDILAMNETYCGSPDFYKTILNQVGAATAAEVAKAGKQWLADGVFILHVLPFPAYETATNDVDRSQLPAMGPPPELNFPSLQRTNLSNGLNVILAERHGVPLVQFDLLVNAGFAADQFAAPGTARLALDMLDEGTTTRTALQINDELAKLGAELTTSSDLDLSTVSLSALTANLEASLDLFADVILNPSFPRADFKRLQQQRLAEIQSEKTEPRLMALRLLPGLLYGTNHAYGHPLTGSGTEAAVATMTSSNMASFHATWFHPNNATLVIVGDTQMKRILPKLEKLFAAWKGGPVPDKNIGPAPDPATALYLVDRPGSLQSMIMVGGIAPPTGNPDEIALETMNNILGGAFTSRLNMNLREDKHWSYGVRSTLMPARGPSPFIIRAPVQTDKTKESLVELDKELRGFVQNSPPTEEELSTAKKDLTLKLPGQWETQSHVAASIEQIVRFGLPENYFVTYPDKVRALDVQQVESAAKLAVRPGHLIWVVVGDRAKIEPGLRELGWGPIQLLDPDGKLVK